MGSKKQRSPRPPCCLPSCTTNGRGSWSVYTLPSSSSSFRRCFFLVFLGVLCCLCLVSLLLIGEEVTCLSPSGVQRHHNPASSSSIPPHRRSRGKHFISLIQEKTQTHPVGADGRRLAGEESKTTQEGELSQHGIRGTGKDNIDLAHKVPVAFVHWEAQSHLQPISSHIQIFETPALEPPPPSAGETKTPPITPVASSIPLSPPSVTPTPPVSSPSPLPIPAAAPPSNGAAVGAAQPSTAAPTVSPSLPLQPQGGAIGGGGGIPPSSPAVVVPQSPGIVVKTEETPHLNQGMAGVGVSPVPGIVAGPSASPPDAVVSATAPSTSQGSPISGAPSLGVSPNPLMVTLLPEGSPAATPIVSATPSVPPQPAGNAGVGALTGGSPSLSPLAVSGTVPGASGSPAPAASSPALTPGQGETTANNPGAVSPGTSSSPSTNTSPSSDASQASTTGGSPPSSSTSPTGPSASGGVTTPSQEGQAAPASGATGGAPSGPPAPSTEGAGENAGTLPLSPSPSETAPSPGLAQAALGNGAVLSGLSKNVGELILRPDGTHAIVGGDLLRAHHDKNVAEIEARLQEAEAERDLAASHGFCISSCECWPVWATAIVLFVIYFACTLAAILMMASLFSKGLWSSTFYRGGGYWLIGSAVTGAATGALIGGLVTRCAATALYLASGLMALCCSFVLVGRRGAWLGAMGGGLTGIVVGQMTGAGPFAMALGGGIGLLLGIITGFAPIARQLKINERYIRQGMTGASTARLPKARTESLRPALEGSGVDRLGSTTGIPSRLGSNISHMRTGAFLQSDFNGSSPGLSHLRSVSRQNFQPAAAEDYEGGSPTFRTSSLSLARSFAATQPAGGSPPMPMYRAHVATTAPGASPPRSGSIRNVLPTDGAQPEEGGPPPDGKAFAV